MGSLAPVGERSPASGHGGVMIDHDHISIDEFSRQSGLAAITIRRYLRSGHLPYVQPGGRKHRILIPVTALERVKTPVSANPPPGALPAANPPPHYGRKPGWKAGPRTP